MRRFKVLPLLALSLAAHAQIHLGSSESYTQEQSQEYCKNLGASWRLMGIDEIYALPKSTPFHEGFSYWSADQAGSDSTEVGTGSEGDGGTIAMLGYSFYPKERNITLSPPTKRIAAICTNDVKAKRLRDYRITSSGIEDKESGVLWHTLDATDKRAKYAYSEAAEMCENLTLHGRLWRLPTVQELYGIVDITHTRPSVDMKFFGAMMHRYYWSSDALNAHEGYVVGFKLGSVATVAKTEAAHVRCVSDLE
ncbi:MAG TPA: DUF1566 domain-containing protein [Sulfuricurvum sp.]|nr:DUF1566 domain-containing protein [Sulfuricurvum sp.]